MKSKYLGFTLVELLISIAIFVSLTGVLLANFRQGDYSEELRLSAELLAVNLREAQTRSISGIDAASVNGYGVYLDNGDTSFKNYKDLGATDKQYDAGEEINTVNLKKNVSFSTSGIMDIFFFIPGGEVYLNGVSQTSSLTVTLQHGVSGKSIDVTILPFSGQVSVGDIY